MREQIYAANSSANDILKIYFPEQFGERQFLNYPIGHFFLAIANMWNPEKNEILISDINDVRECLGANILSEDVPGQLVSIFGRVQALFDGCVSIKQMRKRLKSLKKNMKYITDSLEQEYVSHISYYAVSKNEIEKFSSALEELEDMEYAEKTGKKHIITTSIEHKAILEIVKALEKKGYDIELVDPERSGFVKPEDILSRVREDTLLVSVMHVNNETGIIQPVEYIGKALSERKVLFHVDATQSCGKLIKEIRGLNYNMLSFSAHKLQGPQGIGVLVLRKDGYRLPPIKGIMYGGQQEHGIRPGTIPVALVAGCGYACEIASLDYERNKEKMDALKKLVLTIFDESGMEYHLNGDQRHCVNSVVNICIPGVVSEALMIMAKQYCSISNGSACTSKNYSPSYVLKAMGIPEEEIECSVRISWGPDTSENELKENLVKLIKIAKQIKG